MPDQASDQLRPFGPRVLVADPPADDTRGIILPDGVGDRLKKGIVVAVGGGEIGQMMMGCELYEGDLIYYRPNCAHEIESQRIIGIECVVAYRRTELSKLPENIDAPA